MELVRIIGETLAFVSDYRHCFAEYVYEICLYSVLKCSNLFHLQKCNNRLRLSLPAAQAEVTSIMTEHSHQFANVSSLRKFQQENDYGSAMVAL
jgi:hypothetical protein